MITGSIVLSAFLAGLLGSAHCLGMCAGLSGLSTVAGVGGRSRIFTYNAGRLLSYSIIGALGGAAGASVANTYQLYSQVNGLRIAGGVIICLIGLQIALQINLLRAVEAIGARAWNAIGPLARRFLPVTNHRRALGLGLLWGWLPCGLVYSVLLIAMTSGSSMNGALVMAAFGAGTLPAMLLTGVSAQALARYTARSNTRRAMGLLLFVMGLLTIAMPLGGSIAAGHSH